MKQKAILALLAAAAFTLTACGHHEGPKPGQLTLGMVTDVGGLGDKSFNDSAYSGLQRAQAQLGAYIQVLQSTSAADYQPNLNALVNRKFQMIYAVGNLMMNDVAQVAKQNPKSQFTIIDAVVNDPNVVSITFEEEDGSFLAGALAALVSKTHRIGFIGGENIPLIQKFQAGYVAGAEEIDPTIKVDVKYASSFEDVASGKEIANLLYSQGDDIIYTAAGKVGLGAIDAAKNRKNCYIIGVDNNQDYLAPGKILTSMVKHVDVAVYDVANALKQGKPLHGHIVLGLKDQGISLTDFQYTKDIIGVENIDRVNALQQDIINGRIKPPSTLAGLAAFKPIKI